MEIRLPDGKLYFTKREREHNKANKVLKNNKNATFAKISRYDWLSLDFPVSVREKVKFFLRKNGQERIFCEKAKISNCACPRDNFPVSVSRRQTDKWKSSFKT